jgi:serine/threonine protein kinase
MLREEGEVVKRFTSIEMRYELVRVIGEGTFGRVYLARKDNREYALKKMNKQKEGLPVTTIREIQLLRCLEHPNIIKLLEMVVDTNANDIFMVFPFVSYDLSRFLKYNRLTREEIKYVFHQIVRGVKYIHASGILHRDLKSANILLDRRLHVNIADFGMSRYTSKSGSYSPGVVTLWYRAPEILLGSTGYTCAADIWSIGCILAEMYVGRPLFQGDTEYSQLEGVIHVCGSINESSFPDANKLPNFHKLRLPQSPRRIENMIEKYGVDAAELISRMLSIDPQKRISAEEILSSRYFGGFLHRAGHSMHGQGPGEKRRSTNEQETPPSLH